MIATVIVAALLLLSLPALLPRWHHVGIGVAVAVAFIVAAAVYSFRDLTAHPSGGDGPAFFGLAFLFGGSLGIIAASAAARALIELLVSKYKPSLCKFFAVVLLWFGCAPPLLLLAACLFEPRAVSLVWLALIFSYPLLWLGVAVKLAPNNSSKPTPLRGAA